MKKFLKLLWDAFQSMLMKCISFKNIIFAVATYVGVKVAFKLEASFMDWSIYQMVLLVLFYSSNQLQKWILSRKFPKGNDGD